MHNFPSMAAYTFFFYLCEYVCACLCMHEERYLLLLAGLESGSLHSVRSALDTYCTHTLKTKTSTCALSLISLRMKCEIVKFSPNMAAILMN